jgi:hypothetical protein
LENEQSSGPVTPDTAASQINVTVTGAADPAAAAPEPTSLAVFGLTTLAGAGYWGWRRRKRSAQP